MAKSKSGGTRSFLRGRVGSDVYSIGKDGNGKKQQVVRALAETVANPQTLAQMAGRMIMSTVMQAQSQLSALVDHSFDGVPTGQPSISEFIRLNYELLKARNGKYNEYKDRGILPNEYIIARGAAVIPAGISVSTQGLFNIQFDKIVVTVADLKEKLGFISGEDYYTFVTIDSDKVARFVRIGLAPGLDDETVLSQENIASMLTVSGRYDAVALSYATSEDEGVAGIDVSIRHTGEGEVYPLATCIIVSNKTSNGWIHNNASIAARALYPITPNWNAALATYPLGKAMFLNGGEL